MYAVVLVLCSNFAGIMCSNFNLSFNSDVHCAIIHDREALTLCVHVAWLYDFYLCRARREWNAPQFLPFCVHLCHGDLSKSYVWIFTNFLLEVAVWNVRVKNYQVCSVQYDVQQLYAVLCIHIWTDLTVGLWIRFCLTGPISLCLDSFLCMYVFCVYYYIICFSIVTWWDGPGGIETWFLGPLLPSVLWHCWLGHLTHKDLSLIGPIMCLVGH